MNTDVRGCSTCPTGQERSQRFYSHTLGGFRYQYDYRTRYGKLFSCIGRSLEACRAKRDIWLAKLDAELEAEMLEGQP